MIKDAFKSSFIPIQRVVDIGKCFIKTNDLDISYDMYEMV